MKNKFLFSTLIMAAAFSACSQEDIVVNNENVSSFEEVVGANLLGEGLAIRVGNSNESRATATGWEKGVDVAGLGWVVKGAPESDQSNVELIEVGNNIYANHFYQYEGEGIWSTKSNIYEGWHFAYFPYAHKTRPGALSFTVNDKVYSGGEYMADLRNNSLYLSGAIHLNANNVDEANGTIEASFNITRVVNALYPTLQIDEAFTGHEELQKISIKNFTVGITDKSKFAKTINVVPSKLPVGDIESVDALYADGALVAGEYGKSITTTLAKDAFKLDKNQLMRIFMAPVKKQWNNKANLYFRIDVDGGHFDVKYTTGNEDELTAIQKTNNEAIDKMNSLIASEGGWAKDEETIYNLQNVYKDQFSLQLALGLENFTADYLISSIEDWEGAVKLANALKEENPVFVLAEDADVVFTKEITAPNKGVTVVNQNDAKPGKLTIAADLKWNNAVVVNRQKVVNENSVANKVSIVVAKDNTLTVENCKLQPYRLFNYGTIAADAKSTIGMSGYDVLKYNNRIEIEYGAYVYPAQNFSDECANIIAYEVPAAGELTVAQIQKRIGNLIATDANVNVGYANVNTLVVKEGVSLNLTIAGIGTEGTEGEDDPYRPVQGTQGTPGTDNLIAGLGNVKFEINGGDVTSTLTAEVKSAVINGGSMANVNLTEGLNATNASVSAGTINGAVVADNTEITAQTITGNVTLKGESAINNAVINGNVTVEDGTITLTEVTINGTLTIKKGAKVVASSENIMSITAIVNNGGELESDNDIKVTDITLQNKSVTTLGADWDKTIWYTGNYVHNNSSVNGWVKKCPETADELQSALEGAVEGSTIYLNDNVADYGTITVGELKNVIIEGNENSVVIFNTDANTKIKNVTLKAVNFQYTGATTNCGVVVNANAQIDNLVLENCTFIGDGSKAGRGLYGQNTNATIVIKNSTFKNLGYSIYTMAEGGWKSLIVENCTFENIKSWAIMPQYGSYTGDLTVTGCDFINCIGGGLIKTGAFTAGHTFTFTNNTVTGCTVAGDHNWFSINASAGKTVISGNTKDGQAWTPTAAEGLTK